MKFVLKAVNSKVRYPFIEEINCFILHIDRIRIFKRFKELSFDDVQLCHTPAQIVANCIKHMRNLILIDDYYIKFMINLDDIELTKEIAKLINSKMDKIKKLYE